MEFVLPAFKYGLLHLYRDKYRQFYSSGHNEDKDIKFLNKELRSMRAALSMVAEQPSDQLDEQIKFWVRDLRERSYDIEDFLDTIQARAVGDELATNNTDGSQEKGLTKKMPINPIFRKDIGVLKETIKELHKRRKSHRIDTLPSATVAVVNIDPRLVALFVDSNSLVGVAEATGELTRRLIQQDDGVPSLQLRVVSLVGPAGVGKTTLANLSYQRIKSKFECKAFVSLSPRPHMKSILLSIWGQFGIEDTRDMDDASRDQTKIIDMLKRFLQDKRYLIIIDDIWDTKSWITIKCALVDNNLGSRIVITTRKLDIAEEIGSGTVYKVKPLSYEDSKILFYKRIFGNKYECTHREMREFVEIGDEIVKKCEGLPLDIITFSSILASRARKIQEWYRYKSFVEQGFGFRSEQFDNTRCILSFSYYNLPSHLRTCLHYASVFPKDYVIRRDRLVWLWIAEGFVQGKQGCNLFETGQRYFNDLVNSSMIQEIDMNEDDGVVRYCRFGYMVHSFISHMSYEENFVTILSDERQQQIESRGQEVRRLSLHHACTCTDAAHLSRVRSVTAFALGINLMPLLSSFRFLRVMDLEGSDLQSYDPMYFGKLLLLRYLGLRGTLISELPKGIENLRMLLVLDLKGTRVKELPSKVTRRLKRLLCLYLESTTKLPQGLGNLTSLEELSKVSIREPPKLLEEVASLVNLRVLGIMLQQDADDSSERDFLVSLCNLHKLQTLRIFGCGCSDLDSVFEGWAPPTALRRFFIVNCLFSVLPSWISPMNNLSDLQIGVRELWREGLQTLGRLPKLFSLQLTVKHMMEKLVVDADAFPRLRELRLRCETCLVFRRGAMPAIRTLEFALDVDKANGEFDWGLENLTLLEQVTTILRCGNATEAEALEAEDALKNTISVHPNRPDLQITNVPSHRERERESNSQRRIPMQAPGLQRSENAHSDLTRS